MHFGPASDSASRFLRYACLLPALALFAACSWAQSPNDISEGEDTLNETYAQGYSLDAPSAADSQKVEDPRLIGYWEHRNQRGKVGLEFLSEHRMVFAGRDATYTLDEGILRVKDELGYTEYSYQVQGDTLILDLTDSTRRSAKLRFTRVSLSPEKTADR